MPRLKKTGGGARTADAAKLPGGAGADPPDAEDIAPARRPRLEWALVAAASGLALWIVASTMAVIRAGYNPLPAWDEWDRWSTYLTDHYSLFWFFRQHTEHRLAVPKVLFAIDHLVFSARNWFLLVCTFCLQALTAVMLWRLSARVCRQECRERMALGAVIVGCLFSAQQYVNFIWGFQVQFALVHCAAVAAFFALLRSEEQRMRDGRGAAWIAASVSLAAAATYSMGSGLLVWPVALVAAICLRVPWRRVVWLAAGAVLIGAPYFYHWQRPGNPPNPLGSPARAWRTVEAALIHLGSPVDPLASLGSTVSFRPTCAAVLGGLLGLAAAAGFAMVWWRGRNRNGAQVVLLHICVFLLGTSALIGLGRSEYGLTYVLTSRYFTPAYLFWVCLLIAAWPLLLRLRREALYAGLCTALLAGIAIHQRAKLTEVREWAAGVRQGETAVVAGVLDPGAWAYAYHTPPLAIPSVDYLKEQRLSIFTEEWTHWPGIPLDRRFSIDRQNACAGRFEELRPIPSLLKPGWRASGWAWDARAGRPPRLIVLGDDAGLVAGVALAGFPQPPGLSEKYASSPWRGYIAGEARKITAYVLEADERSLCAIGTQTARGFGGEVNFTELGAPLADGAVEIAGAWTKNGYFSDVGRPPVDGAVFGSYSGADSNTGTLRLGPFHLDGRAAIALPLVTGPQNTGLSVSIRDAATKEILADLTPPPVHPAWWAWQPDLPVGRELAIEIIAEDKGTGFGQWQAVGWPHLLRK